MVVLLYGVALQVCVCELCICICTYVCVCMFSWNLSIDGYIGLSKIHYKVLKYIKDEQEEPGLW
jgi:hypothetical protein